jgi:hypothetical protein
VIYDDTGSRSCKSNRRGKALGAVGVSLSLAGIVCGEGAPQLAYSATERVGESEILIGIPSPLFL